VKSKRIKIRGYSPQIRPVASVIAGKGIGAADDYILSFRDGALAPDPDDMHAHFTPWSSSAK
jgi:hypothetical protein